MVIRKHLPEGHGPLSPEVIEAGNRIFAEPDSRTVLMRMRIGDTADKPDIAEQLFDVLPEVMIDVNK